MFRPQSLRNFGSGQRSEFSDAHSQGMFRASSLRNFGRSSGSRSPDAGFRGMSHSGSNLHFGFQERERSPDASFPGMSRSGSNLHFGFQDKEEAPLKEENRKPAKPNRRAGAGTNFHSSNPFAESQSGGLQSSAPNHVPRPKSLFTANLRKPPGTKWGMDLDCGYVRWLMVRKVGEGPIAQYNRLNNDAMLEPGDWVVRANDAMTPEAMAHFVMKADELRLVIMKSWCQQDKRRPGC